jgi:hypothetical protein
LFYRSSGFNNDNNNNVIFKYSLLMVRLTYFQYSATVYGLWYLNTWIVNGRALVVRTQNKKFGADFAVIRLWGGRQGLVNQQTKKLFITTSKSGSGTSFAVGFGLLARS